MNTILINFVMLRVQSYFIHLWLIFCCKANAHLNNPKLSITCFKNITVMTWVTRNKSFKIQKRYKLSHFQTLKNFWSHKYQEWLNISGHTYFSSQICNNITFVVPFWGLFPIVSPCVNYNNDTYTICQEILWRIISSTIFDIQNMTCMFSIHSSNQHIKLFHSSNKRSSEPQIHIINIHK